MIDTNLRLLIAEHLDAAERAIAAARALLIPSLDDQIVATIRTAECPLTMAEIVKRTEAEYSSVGAALSRMHKNGMLVRGRIRRDKTQRRYYAYEVAK